MFGEIILWVLAIIGIYLLIDKMYVYYIMGYWVRDLNKQINEKDDTIIDLNKEIHDLKNEYEDNIKTYKKLNEEFKTARENLREKIRNQSKIIVEKNQKTNELNIIVKTLIQTSKDQLENNKLNDYGLKPCPHCGCSDITIYETDACSQYISEAGNVDVHVRCPECECSTTTIEYKYNNNDRREIKEIWNNMCN